MPDHNGERVTINCKVGLEGAKALQIKIDMGEWVHIVWIPWSCVHEIHRDDGTVVIDRWLAIKENLI